MKTKRQIITSMGLIILSMVVISLIVVEVLYRGKTISLESTKVLSAKVEYHEEIPEAEEEVMVIEDPIVYDNMTMDELAEKLNRSLNSTLSGYGYLFASYSLELGIDPYLALAIVLHETGCKWECSYLTRVCNNVGGQKGSPSCNGGSYKRYDTLEEGIKGYLTNLYNGYISKGLTTPEQIGPKYAGSTSWPSKINWYIEYIKAN